MPDPACSTLPTSLVCLRLDRGRLLRLQFSSLLIQTPAIRFLSDLDNSAGDKRPPHSFTHIPVGHVGVYHPSTLTLTDSSLLPPVPAMSTPSP